MTNEHPVWPPLSKSCASAPIGTSIKTASATCNAFFTNIILFCVQVNIRAGELIWVSGVVGMTRDGVIPECTVEQFDIALEAMDTCLRAAGGRSDTVTKVQIFLTDITDRASINPARIAYFGEHRPASTLVEVSALVDPRMKVEIECMGLVGQ